MSVISAAELRVSVIVESSDAAARLREMQALVQNVGQARIPDDLQRSIANIGNVSESTAKSVQELAQAQQNIRVDNAANQYQNLTGKLEIARQKMSELTEKYGEGSTQAKNAALAVQTLENKVSTANASLQLQKDKLDSLKSSNLDAATAVQLLANQYGNANVAVQALENQISQTKNTLKEQKAALDLLKNGAEQAKSPIQNLTVEVTALANTHSKFSALTEVMVGGLRRIGSEIVSNIGPAIASMVGQGANLEQTLNVLGASSSATADQMAMLAAKANALGADMALPGTSANDAALAMLELNKAGMDVNSTMAASQGVLRLSAAAQIDNATAAEITANALNTFNLEASEANRVADLLAGGANASSASITDLAQGVQQAGFAFTASGQSIEDLITSVAALTNVGLSGSDGATALKNAMLQIMAPTNAAKSTMEQYGIAVRDASGNMKPIFGIIEEFRTKLEGLTPAQRDSALKTILQSDGMKAFIPLMNLGADGLEELKVKTTEYNAAGKMSEAQMKGFNGAVDNLKSQLQTLATNAITPLLPYLEKMVRGLADVASWMSDRVGPAVNDFINGMRLMADGAKVAFDWIGDNATAILMTLEIVLGTAAVAMTAFGIATGASAVSAALAGTSITGLTTSLTGMIGKLALAAGPWVVLAAAIYGAWEIANKYQEVQKQIHDGIDAMLSGKVWWDDATSSLERFRTVQTGASATTKQTATELETLQAQLKELTTAHTAMAKNTDISAEANAEFMRRELELKAAIEQKTTALNNGIAADKSSNQAVGESLAGLRDLREGATSAADGVAEFAAATGLSIEALDRINEGIDKVNSKGFEIFGTMEQDYRGHTESMARLQVEFNQATDEKTKAALAAQLNDQIIAYAQQEQIQRDSIGRQLMALADLEGQKAGLSQAAINEMVNGIAAEYGVMESVTAQAFGGMANSIADWAGAGGKNTADVIASLTQTSDAALATQQAVSTMAGQYELRLETNLKDGQIDAQTFNALMREVPSQHNLTLFENFMSGKLSANEFIAAVNAVPPSKTTVLNVDATSGKAAAYSAGADFVAGMAAGMEANLYMVANASQKTAATAAAAARNYLQIQSPSKLMFIIGGFIPEGMAMGIEAKGSTISEALVSVIGKGASKATIAAAEGIGKIADTVGVAVDALNKLNEFEKPTGDSILSFSESLQTMVTAFAARVIPMKAKAQEALGNYAEMVGKIVSVIGEGADALTSLTDFIAPADMAINSFMASLGTLIYEFGTESADANAELFDASIAFAETAGAAIAIISDGVAAFEALRGFAPVAEIDIKLFLLATRDLVRELGERTKEVNIDLLDASNAFTETAGKAIGIIGDGVEGFALLADFAPIPEVAISLFTLALRDLVRALIARVGEIDIDLLDAANQFTTTAGNAIGVIGDGISAFTLLADYQGTPAAAIEMIGHDISAAVTMMTDIATRFDSESVTATAAFSESVGKIISPISDAVSAFKSLDEYLGVAPGALWLIGQDMSAATNMMIDMAAKANTEQVAAAAEFSTSISTVFDALSGGISALSDLAAYQGIGPDALALIQNDMTAAIGVIQILSGIALSAQSEGDVWANALANFADNIKKGIGSLESINGLSVSISASVSASGSVGGDAAPAVDGSHEMGLARVPGTSKGFYRADLHEGERVLTKENADRQDRLFSILAEMTGGTSGRGTMNVDTNANGNTNTTSVQDGKHTTINVTITDNLDKEVFFYELMERINR